eukprot:GGOE01013720.1.p2 GENE.GGOE01013720.1~~GGOE01013720.1.p2  ORF type:complete len:158 (+),score=33.85 GGOE01013720.1:34-474(+)
MTDEGQLDDFAKAVKNMNYAVSGASFAWGYTRVLRSRNFTKGFLPVAVTGLMWCSGWTFNQHVLLYEAYMTGLAGSSLLVASAAYRFYHTRAITKGGALGAVAALIVGSINGIGAAREWENILVHGRNRRKYPIYVPKYASDIFHK